MTPETLTAIPATRLPGPPELLPGRPDAIVDLQTDEGMAIVAGQWRYSDARVEQIAFVDIAGAGAPDPLGPGTTPNRTYDIAPHAEAVDFDDAGWEIVPPAETMRRRSQGRVCFNWYRTTVTLPERIGDTDVTGATVIFEVTIDDAAEVWVDGRLPLVLGMAGGRVASGFNAPNRVVLTRDARPGQRFQLAVFGINGPISASPRNYIWMRGATLDVYAAERAAPARPATLDVGRWSPALDELVPLGTRLEQVAGGFVFTEGPVWVGSAGLLFSSPDTNAIYRWDPEGSVSVFRPKSGYSGPDIGRYHQPGSNGLTLSPDGLLTICQHGHRRVVRVNPHGDVTVLADAYRGRRLNSPNDLVYRSDGTLYFTDPPFGLPGTFDDPGRELDFSGVFRVRDGEVALLADELTGPNGIALSPDERFLYVGNWDLERKVVMRYAVDEAGDVSDGEVFHDMTDAPDSETAIDGLKVDRAGNLYVCGPGGIWVLSQAGEALGLLRLPETPHNLAWGGDDGRTLYVTASTGIYRLTTGVPGVRPRPWQ